MNRRIGTWAFIGGILLSVLAGLGQLKEAWPIWLLAALGLVVGWLNIRTRETKDFLLAAVALNLSANALQKLPGIGEQVTEILASNIVVFISAALLFIAARVMILRLSKSRAYVIVAACLAVLLAIVLAASSFITGDFGDWLQTNPIIPWLLPALGILIGLVYVTRPTTEGEDDVFILAAISLQLSAGSFNQVPAIGTFLTELFGNLVSMIFAVLLVVAFVTVFKILDKQGD